MLGESNCGKGDEPPVVTHFRQDRAVQRAFLTVLRRYGTEQSVALRRFEVAALAEPRRMLALLATGPVVPPCSKTQEVHFQQDATVQHAFEKMLAERGIRLCRALRAFQQAVVADEAVLLTLLDEGKICLPARQADPAAATRQGSASLPTRPTDPKSRASDE